MIVLSGLLVDPSKSQLSYNKSKSLAIVLTCLSTRTIWLDLETSMPIRGPIQHKQ